MVVVVVVVVDLCFPLFCICLLSCFLFVLEIILPQKKKNRIVELPEEVGDLVALRVLDAHQNQLTSLPPLAKLQVSAAQCNCSAVILFVCLFCFVLFFLFVFFLSV